MIILKMFLVASIEAGGIPFAVTHGVDRDEAIREAIARRKAGKRFYSVDETLVHMRTAISEGINDARA
jgi:antitoxin component of RelBE/YafQ-DinJ toxin-antitoxin module